MYNGFEIFLLFIIFLVVLRVFWIAFRPAVMVGEFTSKEQAREFAVNASEEKWKLERLIPEYVEHYAQRECVGHYVRYYNADNNMCYKFFIPIFHDDYWKLVNMEIGAIIYFKYQMTPLCNVNETNPMAYLRIKQIRNPRPRKLWVLFS